MSEYISREAAIEAICEDCLMHKMNQCKAKTKEMYCSDYQRITAIPAAAVRPVVLCKDCIHCKKGKASLECEKHTYAWKNMRRWVDEDDFCKWGVKREES